MSLDATSRLCDTVAMQDGHPINMYLTRIDRSRNMARFYAMTLHPTLFGEVALLRVWGRTGRAGQSLMQTFDDGVAAGQAQARLERAKRRRGYSAG